MNPKPTKYVIEDEIHAEMLGDFVSFELAITELKRLKSVPWDASPNRAPCTNWITCGRRYEIVDYDSTQAPWVELARTPILEVSASEIKWLAPFSAEPDQ